MDGGLFEPNAGIFGRDDMLNAGHLGWEDVLNAGILGAGGPAAMTKYPWLAISVSRFVYDVPGPPQAA